jgi:hypothetical protein
MELANPASIPRSERVLSRADCASGAVGEAVYITGAAVGNKLQVARLDVTASSDPPFAAVIVKDLGGGECIVQAHGTLRGILTGLTPGAFYFVDSDGTLTDTPAVSSHLVGQAYSDDILIIDPLNAAASGGAEAARIGVRLVGTYNSLNRVFTVPAPDKFIHDAVQPGRTIAVYHNGRRLTQSLTGSPVDGMFVVSESGGVGTGFDTVTLTALAPATVRSRLFADYSVVV